LQDKGATNKKLWYLDSGCSKHMTGDESLLTGLTLKHGGYVTYGDNNKGKIIGSGDIGVKGSLTIQNVLLVEGLKHNLLSISQLSDKGMKVKGSLTIKNLPHIQ